MALEFTWGDENGWHPHYHVLLVHHRDLDAAAVTALHAHIHSRLAASCRDRGLREPDQLHAVRIDPNVSATAAGAYVAKGGDWTPADEMTRGDLKTGRPAAERPSRSSPTTTRPATRETGACGATTAASLAACRPCAGHVAFGQSSSARRMNPSARTKNWPRKT
jgi:hypothetical protein